MTTQPPPRGIAEPASASDSADFKLGREFGIDGWAMIWVEKHPSTRYTRTGIRKPRGLLEKNLPPKYVLRAQGIVSVPRIDFLLWISRRFSARISSGDFQAVQDLILKFGSNFNVWFARLRCGYWGMGQFAPVLIFVAAGQRRRSGLSTTEGVVIRNRFDSGRIVNLFLINFMN